MSDITNTQQQQDYWTLRYKEKRTGWDIGYPSAPLQAYIDQLTNKDLKILIPGAGNAYEAKYLFEQGFKNTYVLDISIAPLRAFKKNIPGFPKEQIIHANFFEHQGSYDLILEQTFFCSFPPTKANRRLYAQKMSSLLNPNGKLVGLWFNHPLKGDLEKRPFGGNKKEYLTYLNPYFNCLIFDSCYNSIEPRKDSELFGILQKKKNNH